MWETEKRKNEAVIGIPFAFVRGLSFLSSLKGFFNVSILGKQKGQRIAGLAFERERKIFGLEERGRRLNPFTMVKIFFSTEKGLKDTSLRCQKV